MVYLVGGKSSGTPSTLLERYDPAENAWTPLAEMRVARYGAMVKAVAGKIYVIGGTNGAAMLSSVEVYDTHTDSWTELQSAMPTARCCGGIAAVEGSSDTHLVVFGGRAQDEIVNVMEQMDVSTGGWATMDHPMPMPRAEFAYVQKMHTVYVLGGRDLGDDLTSSVAQYDALAGTWQGMTDLPVKVAGGAATIDEEANIYLVGGQVQAYTDEADASTVWVYSPVSAQWNSVPGYTSLHGAAAATVDGTLYVFGGAHGRSELGTVVEYDENDEGGEYVMHADGGSETVLAVDPDDNNTDESHHPVLVTLVVCAVTAGLVYLAYGFVQRWNSGARTVGEVVGDKRADEVWDKSKEVAGQAADAASDLLTKARAKAGGFAPVPAVDEDEIEEIVMDAQNVPNGYGAV